MKIFGFIPGDASRQAPHIIDYKGMSIVFTEIENSGETVEFFRRGISLAMLSRYTLNSAELAELEEIVAELKGTK